ncbi:MAG: LysE family translocator [Gammaproteobacteria bacterium]|nr:LysE family translocator [Gammaproteobacteria bacterium]MDH4253217.1 LysE family translocator [Gammaproteobacteria bacterium]MDH5309004.1 LysE family translocator [Gammaproteobacteria bacterium]
MENVLALAIATGLLVMIPGPNVALIVATCLGRGLRQGLLTVVGTTLGVAVQLTLVVAGLATLVESAAVTLYWLKWLGAAYLVWLGIRSWRRATLAAVEPPAPARRAFWRGLLLAILNPKTLLFNAAFLPQFVGSAANAAGELTVLAAVYLFVIGAGDSLWALCAGSARRWLERSALLRERVTGSLLITAGLGLALAARRNA